ncbi:MAG: DHA2 family efflux MFS transporter permease subunit [Caldilineaceae bacterium]
MQQTAIDYSRKWYVMSAVAMGIFLGTIDGSIVNVALPTLVHDLQTDFAIVQWVVLAYLLTLGTLLLTVGRFADIYGKKRIYVSGFLVFTLGSVLCGLAPTIYWLIGLRVLQAVGAAMIFALGPAIVTEAFPTSERGKALGITGSIVSLGIVAGPVLGGILIGALSWHWIFFVNLPVGLVGTWIAWRTVPDTRPVGQQRFDYWGAITLFVSLLSLLLGLTLGQEAGFLAPVPLALFVVWAVTLAFFIVLELRIPQPMIDLRLFQNRLLTTNLVTGFLAFVAIAGTILLLPFYLENILGFSVEEVGLLLSVTPIALGITAPIAGSLSDRLGARPIILVGLLLLVIGYLAISTLSADTTIVGYLLRMTPMGLGMGIFQSPNNSVIMGAAPRAQLGIVSSLLSVTRTLGQTTGIAILGALWASRVYTYTGAVLPAGATSAPVAAQVAGLQDTYQSIALLMVAALLLGLWGYWQERKDVAVTEQEPSVASGG